MSGRRIDIDWPAVALYVVLGVVGLAFIGYVLWRLALAVDWMAAALLGLVIAFGLLMVSFDLRRGSGAEAGDPTTEATLPRPRRGRPRKPPTGHEAPAAVPDPPAEDAPIRGPRNRAGRAPIAEPPARRRPRRRS
jgi:hypothetical protein